jgi:hypothetical protein
MAAACASPKTHLSTPPFWRGSRAQKNNLFSIN